MSGGEANRSIQVIDVVLAQGEQEDGCRAPGLVGPPTDTFQLGDHSIEVGPSPDGGHGLGGAGIPRNKDSEPGIEESLVDEDIRRPVRDDFATARG